MPVGSAVSDGGLVRPFDEPSADLVTATANVKVRVCTVW
jgi:hypothetical protein